MTDLFTTNLGGFIPEGAVFGAESLQLKASLPSIPSIGTTVIGAASLGTAVGTMAYSAHSELAMMVGVAFPMMVGLERARSRDQEQNLRLEQIDDFL